MERTLGCEALPTGETLQVVVVETPDMAFAEGIRDLLAHKGPEWQDHIRAALGGDADGLETRFYLGLLDGRPVANIMTTESLGIGILGHVFTRPEHRRKGICKAVMARQMADFVERGGHVLLLGTGFESTAYWIYHSFGFRSLAGGFMRYSSEPGLSFEDAWFAAGGATVVPFRWGHAPRVAFLASVPGRERLRSVGWDVVGIGNLEWATTHFMSESLAGRQIHAVVLEKDSGAIVGCATLSRHRAGMDPGMWPGVWLVDVFTHSNFESRIPELIAGLPAVEGKVIVYVGADAPWKGAALGQAGFRHEATLPRMLRSGGEPLDVLVYGKEMA